MSNLFLYVGLVFVAIGILIIAFSAMGKSGESKTEVGVGGFIGPVPFGFATSRGMLYFVVTLSLVAFILLLFLGPVLGGGK